MSTYSHTIESHEQKSTGKYDWYPVDCDSGLYFDMAWRKNKKEVTG